MITKLTTIEDIKNNAITTTLNDKNTSKMKDFGFEDISMPEFPEDISMPEFPIPEVPTNDDSTNDDSTNDDSTDCDKFLEKIFALKEKPTNVKQFSQIQLQQVKIQAQLIYQNMINQLVQLKDMIKGAWNAVKEMVKKIINEIKEQYKIIIAYFNAEFIKIKNLFKKLKKATTKEEREKRRKQIKEEAKKYGGEVLEMLGIIELYNTLKDLWNALKNMWGMAKSGWKSIIDNFKNLKSLLKDNETPLGRSILAWIIALLPLVSQLALAVLGAIKFAKEQQKLNDKLTEDAIKDVEPPTTNNTFSTLLENVIEKQNKDNTINNSNNNSNISNQGGSIFDNNSKNNTNNKALDSSCISICPVNYDTNGLVEEKYGGYLLEIGSDVFNYSFKVNEKDIIKVEDIIGYVDNIPIISKINGIVKEKKEKYIIVEPETITEKFNIEVKEEDEKITNLINAFDDINKIETVLKDDLFYLYKNILYNNCLGTSYYENSLQSKYDNIIYNHEKNIESLQNKLKNIASKDNIEKQLEKENGLLLIKDELFEVKKNFFNNIIETFIEKNNSLYSYNKCDYELLDYYYNFIINFNYDKENSYKNELFELVLSFIKERQNIEIFNRNQIINSFNSIALSITKNKNYFYTIKNKNLNISLKDNIIDSKKDIELIYKTIKENCKLKNIEEKTFDVDASNVNDFIANNSNSPTISNEDKEIIEKDKIAKKLAILFYIYNYTKDIKITKTKNELLADLKKQTKKESKKIISYFDNIISKYKTANDKTNNIDKLFNEIDWINLSDLYIDDIKYNHYLFRNTSKNHIITNNNNSDNSNNKGNNGDNINNNDYNNNTSIITPEEGNNQLSTKTQNEATTYLYWLKYCGMATLMNCALPMYWGTGLITPVGPLSLPIILIPIYVLNGNCICVFGLGICGIAIYPMMLFSNLSTNVMTYLAPVNVIIDLLKNTLNMLKEQTKMSIKPLLQGPISLLDEQIKQTEMEINNMKKEISLTKSL